MNFLRFRAGRVPVERMIVPPIGANADPTTLHASFAVSLGGVLTMSELIHLRPQKTGSLRRHMCGIFRHGSDGEWKRPPTSCAAESGFQCRHSSHAHAPSR